MSNDKKIQCECHTAVQIGMCHEHCDRTVMPHQQANKKEAIMTCAKPNMVTCDMHKVGEPCNNCVDVTIATDFLLSKLKPKSGSLKNGIINTDAVPLLMTEFLKSITQA